MKIKPIVVSLIALGLSSSAFAVTGMKAASHKIADKSKPTQGVEAKNATTLHGKPVLRKDDANSAAAIKRQIADLQAQLASMNQSSTVPKATKEWYKHLRVSGLVNVDTSYWSRPNFGQGTGDTKASSYLSLATANLNLDGYFGPWVTTHVGVLYTNGSSPSVINFRPSNNANRRVKFEEAYGTIANFSKSPFFFRAGLQFVPFGHYHRYPITQTLTQVLSQTDLPTIQAGFISRMGFYASAYVMSGERKVTHSNSNRISNYGGAFGYENLNNPVGVDAGVGFLKNMADVDAIRQTIKRNNGYTRSVSAMSFYGDVYAGPFGLGLRYVTALRRFSAADYQYTHNATTKGAKPYAAGINADYNFKMLDRNARVSVGYQWSGQAHNTATGVPLNDVTRLPKTRWIVGYGINLVRHVALQLQYYQDKDYKASQGGTGRRNNVVTARFSFLF